MGLHPGRRCRLIEREVKELERIVGMYLDYAENQAARRIPMKMADWVRQQNYRPEAVNAFLQDTDYFLIAFALAHEHVVVTHEIASDGVKRVKIPTVCIGLKIKCIGPYQMLRSEHARFVLGRRTA